MNVLVINCGSSSLKFQLINSETEAVLAKGLCENHHDGSRLVLQPAGHDKSEKKRRCRHIQKRLQWCFLL